MKLSVILSFTCSCLIALSLHAQNTPNTQNQSDSAKQAMQKAMMQMFGKSAKVQKSYNFNSSYHMQVEISGKDKSQNNKVDYDMLINKSTGNICMDNLTNPENNSKVKMIIDPKNKAMISLVEQPGGKKMGFSMSFNPDEFTQNEKAEKGKMTFTKTGKSKKILGYTCYEYKITGNDMSGETWITNDVDINTADIYKMFASKKNGSSAMDNFENFPKGFVMESNMSQKSTGENYKMTVTKLDLHANNTISTEGYQIMDMGDAMNQNH